MIYFRIVARVGCWRFVVTQIQEEWFSPLRGYRIRLIDQLAFFFSRSLDRLQTQFVLRKKIVRKNFIKILALQFPRTAFRGQRAGARFLLRGHGGIYTGLSLLSKTGAIRRTRKMYALFLFSLLFGKRQNQAWAPTGAVLCGTFPAAGYVSPLGLSQA